MKTLEWLGWKILIGLLILAWAPFALAFEILTWALRPSVRDIFFLRATWREAQNNDRSS